MAKGVTDSRYYKNIADAIRGTGSYEGPIAPVQMAECITEIGQNAYQAGVQSEYDRFWNMFQSKGAAKSYGRAFAGECWTKELFTPKYDIVATNLYATFQGSALTDIAALLEKTGRCLDTSQATNVEYAFNSRYITRVPVISTVNAPALTTTFGWTSSLVTIEKLILKEDGTQTFLNTFTSAIALQNIVIEGKIGQNGFDISWSPLTHDSLMSIINALQDKTGTGTSWTVTLGTTNLAKLADSEKAIATQKGWTLA